MIELADIERVTVLAKSYLADRRKFDSQSNRAMRDGLTPKQAQKANADLNWQAMALEKLEAELHTACVDAGLADLREASHYGERTFRPSGWHEYRHTPTMPRALRSALS